MISARVIDLFKSPPEKKKRIVRKFAIVEITLQNGEQFNSYFYYSTGSSNKGFANQPNMWFPATFYYGQIGKMTNLSTWIYSNKESSWLDNLLPPINTIKKKTKKKMEIYHFFWRFGYYEYLLISYLLNPYCTIWNEFPTIKKDSSTKIKFSIDKKFQNIFINQTTTKTKTNGCDNIIDDNKIKQQLNGIGIRDKFSLPNNIKNLANDLKNNIKKKWNKRSMGFYKKSLFFCEKW